MAEPVITIRSYGHAPVTLTHRQILYLRAEGKYTRFFLTDNREVLSSYTLKRYNALLPHFWRTSKTYLINPLYVRKYAHRGGIAAQNGYVKLKGGLHFEVARRRVADFPFKYFRAYKS
ncbi:LytR/AlgR family response regulator transcription factor [Larkinella soli]|uniref:LytR/AlgR family response regulator transcription factor n=1 Tax=Larkinella soli TaxID=1770527 RepID=UPI0013E30BD6|nr:LytTR family DNA-binding domain-containing protein [Larkinella soli]